MNIETVVQEVFRLYDRYGRAEYIGEDVSIVQHSVQCATCAEGDNASDEIILAAFLHDIGHLIGLDENIPPMITNGRNIGTQDHDVIGGEFLKKLGLPSLVCEIVGGHVNAKRYLVYKDKDYYAKLSETSKQTLEHQGGMMTSSEAKEFEKSAVFDAIIRMRTWDERAKDTRVTDVSIDKYKQLCARVLTECVPG